MDELWDSEKSSAALAAAANLDSVLTQSPALATRVPASPGAYEMKCLLDEATARAVESFLRSSLRTDPFAEAGGGQYAITTLSTDTEDFKIYSRQPGVAQQKLRVRRYGSEPRVYLEQKTRRGNKVRKVRTAAAPSELMQLAGADTGKSWAGDWFQAKVNRRRLLPVCLMAYERSAWFGESENGPVRLTFDRNLRGRLCREWSMEIPDEVAGDRLIPVVDGVICEFKFSATLPQIFKSAFQEFMLAPAGFSKYRHCLSRLTGRSLTSENSEETRRA